MKLMYAGSITRPPGVDDNDPVPVALHNPLPLYMQVKWVTGGYFKNLDTCSAMYCTVKSDLALADNAAEIHLAQYGSPDPFTIVSVDYGKLNCIIPGSQMETLLIDTLYYVDVELVHGGEPYTILFDTIRPFQPVTKTVT